MFVLVVAILLQLCFCFVMSVLFFTATEKLKVSSCFGCGRMSSETEETFWSDVGEVKELKKRKCRR